MVDSQGMIAGVITDGDLRRFLEKGVDVYTLGVEEVMSKSPSVIYEGKFAIDASAPAGWNIPKFSSLNP